MLVSTMVRFNAMNNANNAAFLSVQNSNSMLNAVDNAHNFNGVKGIAAAHKIDKSLSLKFLTDKLFAKLSMDSVPRKVLDVLA